ncbi:MAG: TPR repeat protein [Chlamydiales bacterium]|jgi:TPR repeat protein
MGARFSNGDGVEKDKKIAIEWYLKAWDSGNIDASYHLGLAYNLGQGVEVDHKKAIEWLQKGADEGVQICLSVLGWNYENGLGVETDLVVANAYYILAEKEKEVERLRALMTPEEFEVSERAADDLMVGFHQMWAEA